MADTDGVSDQRVMATPYQIGSGVSSVELLLEARTAAEDVAQAASRQLAAVVPLDAPFVVTNVVPGPAELEDAVRFEAEASTGVLGSLLVQRSTIVVFADLIMGGRGFTGDHEPSKLELDLFADRLVGPVSTFLAAVAGGRPELLSLVKRDTAKPALSTVVELSLEHRETAMLFQVEVLAHHLEDGNSALDASVMAAACGEVPLELTFDFPPVRLPAREVASLVVGDVICLEHSADELVIGRVGGTALVSGRVGRSRRHVAVQVVDVIEEGE